MIDTTSTERKSTKQISTIFLRVALVALGVIALGLSALILSEIYTGWEQEFSGLVYVKYVALFLLSLTLVPYFAALYQTFLLLKYIDTNKAFSLLSVNALRKIKYCGAMFSGLFILFLPITYLIAQADDAPGLIIVGMIMAGAPMVIAVFASVLEKLLQSAIDIKTENELTV